jgi:hypothetical protein
MPVHGITHSIFGSQGAATVTYPYAYGLVNAGGETGDMTGWSTPAGYGSFISVTSSTGGPLSGTRSFANNASTGVLNGAGNQYRWAAQQDKAIPSELLADVDAGIHVVRLAVPVDLEFGEDIAMLVLDALSAGGVILGSVNGSNKHGASGYGGVLSVAMVVPANTRTLRLTVITARTTLSVNGRHQFDDATLTGYRLLHTFALTNAGFETAGTSTSIPNWTNENSTVSSVTGPVSGVSPRTGSRMLACAAAGTVRAYQAAAIPSTGNAASAPALHTLIDAGKALVYGQTWVSGLETVGDYGYAEATFLDGASAAVGSTVQSAACDGFSIRETMWSAAAAFGAIPATARTIRAKIFSDRAGPSGANASYFDEYTLRIVGID